MPIANMKLFYLISFFTSVMSEYIPPTRVLDFPIINLFEAVPELLIRTIEMKKDESMRLKPHDVTSGFQISPILQIATFRSPSNLEFGRI